MALPLQFISCDWGTSNFRIRLIDSLSLKVLEEFKTEMGVNKLHKKYKSQSKVSQEQFYKDYLLSQVGLFTQLRENEVLIVASGMITSAIGMIELPYAKVPVSFSCEDLLVEFKPLEKNCKILLISGLKTKNNVMRGEEIQAIGLIEYLPKHPEGILILPGTHSKHINFKLDKINDFTTFMTGELFDVFSKHTILSNSIKIVDWDSKFIGSFLEGVKKGVNNNQLSSFFSIRANHLLYDTSMEKNYYYLSGLLIGSELSYLKNTQEKIYLATSGILHELYLLALTSFISADRVFCFEEEVIDKALIAGHKKMINASVVKNVKV
ncbi:2-dehydro-3-deoxygalactonokinase [uncultured Aquimarina sp.]|uniref:2-dehydro-3-deoxygalactonokinase n=1 Tax=uncultured Aquimarina sp. TaxID=575652 RepID=UPI002620FB7E|nr:2-dehydro-3-deoxygalactonokinase [uncultured Aquimarina sp.]